jgi:hypothetical protein
MNESLGFRCRFWSHYHNIRSEQIKRRRKYKNERNFLWVPILHAWIWGKQSAEQFRKGWRMERHEANPKSAWFWKPWLGLEEGRRCQQCGIAGFRKREVSNLDAQLQGEKIPLIKQDGYLGTDTPSLRCPLERLWSRISLC